MRISWSVKACCLFQQLSIVLNIGNATMATLENGSDGIIFFFFPKAPEHHPELGYWSRPETDYKASAICQSLPVPLTSLCPPLPGSFILLQIHGCFVSPMVKLELLANAPLTVLQSDGIISLLTSITFIPPMPSKLHFFLPPPPIILVIFLLCPTGCGGQ